MSTNDAILEITKDLIQTKGFNSFSYADISEKLGIKKASIHYHFPSKTDLGKAVVIKYTDKFNQFLNEIENDSLLNSWQVLDKYLSAFVEISNSKIKICLCGTLGGEFLTLPRELQVEVKKFFDINLSFLEKILKKGFKNSEFYLSDSPKSIANKIFASLEGGLIIARSKNSTDHYFAIIKTIKSSLKQPKQL